MKKIQAVLMVLLVLAGVALAVMAGIGTGDSFADDGSLWGEYYQAGETGEVESSQ